MRRPSRSLALGFVVLAGIAPRAQAPAAQPPGIYVRIADEGGAERLVPLHGSMVQEIKQKGTLKMMMTQGFAKGSIEGELPGATAATRVRGGDVVIRFVFSDHADSSNGTTFDDPMKMMSGDYMPPKAKSADEFVLLRLNPTSDNKRQAQMGTTGRGGASSKSKDAVAFAAVMTSPHAFVGHPKEPLAPGEYALLWAPNGPGGQMWDFGVDAK